jgi:CRISPR-associated protein Cmr4
VLERLARDRRRSDESLSLPQCEVAADRYLGVGSDLFLEERQFFCGGPLPAGLTEAIGTFVPDTPPYGPTRKRLDTQLVVLHDDDFAWFVRHGLAVQARNVLDEKKKTSLNLWYEESIPSDALFYALLAERQSNALTAISSLFKDLPYLQVGGNETVGMGWFAVSLPTGRGGAA